MDFSLAQTVLEWGGVGAIILSQIGYRYKNPLGPLLGILGCVLFAIWGFTIDAFGVILMNGIIGGIQCWTFWAWAIAPINDPDWTVES